MRPLLAGAVALFLGACNEIPATRPAPSLGAEWITAPGPELVVEREIDAPPGKPVLLVVAGSDEVTVAVDDAEVFLAGPSELQGHLAALDLRAILERAGGRGRVTLAARASGGRPPALLAAVTIGEGSRARNIVTGDGAFRLPSGGQPPLLASGALPPPPGSPLPVLALGRRVAIPRTERGLVLDGAVVGHVDVAFDGPSRGAIKLARDPGGLAAAAPIAYEAPGGRYLSATRETFCCIEVLPESGQVRDVGYLPTGAIALSGTPLAASDPRIATIDARALDAARVVAQAYVETGPGPRALQVARLRGVALALLSAHGESAAVRRSLDLLAASARKGGAVRGHVPGDGEPSLPEPSEALASFVIVLRDYVLYTGDVKSARRLWLPVDRQLTLLHQRTGARQLLDVPATGPGAPRRMRLEPNVLYGAALEAATDLSRWLSRISVTRLGRKSRAVRAALDRHLLQEPTGLYADGRIGDELLPPAPRGNALAALWGPEADPATMARRLALPGGDPEATILAAEAWMRGGEVDKGLALLDAASDATPAYLLRAYVLGVRPSSPGFRTFELSPDLGALAFVEGSVATPAGAIKVRVEAAGDAVQATVESPRGLRGTFRPARGQTIRSVDGKPPRLGRDGSAELPEGARSVVIASAAPSM